MSELKMKTETIYLFIALLAVLALGLFAYFGFRHDSNDRILDIKRDTAYVVTPSEPIFIPVIKPDTIIKYKDRPVYIAKFDTVYCTDTLSLTVFADMTDTNKPLIDIRDFLLRKHPDSVKVVTITVEKYKQRSIWTDILTHSAAVGLGYGLGSVK